MTINITKILTALLGITDSNQDLQQPLLLDAKMNKNNKSLNNSQSLKKETNNQSYQ